MADPNYFYPKLTNVGAAEAINASNDGLELTIDSVSFGTGIYDPDGTETELVDPVVTVEIPGGSRITPNQIRLITVWDDPDAVTDINEVGYWSGDVLVFIWSRTAGGPIGKKTKGVDFVLFHDISFGQLPADSINVQVNHDLNQALAALMNHESANDAHPQYLLRRDFLNAHSLIAASSVGGSVNAINITLPAETVVTQYLAGQQFVFVANGTNTDAVTVNVNGLGAKVVIKNALTPLSGGDIINGSVYTLFFDGTKFQLSAGVSGGASLKRYQYVSEEGQSLFAANYLPGNIFVFVKGELLADNHYVATNGTSVQITSPALHSGDEVIIMAFKSFSVPDAYTKIEVDDLLANLTVPVARISDASTAGRLLMQAVATGSIRFIQLNTDGSISLNDAAAMRAATGSDNASNLTAGTLATARLPALTGEVTLAAGTSVLQLSTTPVAPNTYGDSITIPQLVISNKGRIHGAVGIPIRTASETLPGVVTEATLDGVINKNAGNSSFVNVAKMSYGFDAYIAPTGFIKFPAWMLGIKIAWGTMSINAHSQLPSGDLFSVACLSTIGSLRMASSSLGVTTVTFVPSGKGLICYNSNDNVVHVTYWAVGY